MFMSCQFPAALILAVMYIICSLQQAESIRDQVLQAKEKEATIFHETLQSKTEIIEKLENEIMSLQHQITEKDLCITELKVKSQELQDQVKEMSHLEEQLHQLSSVPKVKHKSINFHLVDGALFAKSLKISIFLFYPTFSR